ncbi:MAG: NADH-quinone oxidoreductase subunit I [Deltaproteobacteria bacterium]|nr:NADH-quinone oxidoreductase subunit I [Deltaproteobacteria bacterium]
MTFSERAYVKEVGRGLGVTFQHFMQTFTRLVKGEQIETVEYPEKRVPYAPRFRGHHRLVPRDDGTARCVACFMCATACPALCIHIEAEPRLDSTTEKQPRIFEIDELRCVDCGLCVEACPCDAIRMDSNIHPPPSSRRDAQLKGRWDLLGVMGIHEDGETPRSARTMNGHVPGKDPGPRHH